MKNIKSFFRLLLSSLFLKLWGCERLAGSTLAGAGGDVRGKLGVRVGGWGEDSEQASRCEDLLVHSSSGVLALMWMLSIQMWPRLPWSKKPSMTTCREGGFRRGRGRGGGVREGEGGNTHGPVHGAAAIDPICSRWRSRGRCTSHSHNGLFMALRLAQGLVYDSISASLWPCVVTTEGRRKSDL